MVEGNNKYFIEKAHKMTPANNTHTNLEEESNDFFCAYGWAVYESSGIEKGLVQIFAIDAYDPTNSETIGSISSIIDEKDALTLGSLIKQAQNKLNLSPEIMAQLSDALEKRNRLIHGFYFDAYSEIIDKSTRDKLVDSLKSMTQNFGNLNNALITEAIKRMQQKGVPENVLNHLAKQVLDELKGYS